MYANNFNYTLESLFNAVSYGINRCSRQHFNYSIFWKVADTLASPGGAKVSAPYPSITYCPICGAPIPRPREDFEPGYPQVMRDFLQILNKYDCNWSYFAWWGATYDAGYGLTLSDMYSLTERGEIWKDYLSASAPT